MTGQYKELINMRCFLNKMHKKTPEYYLAWVDDDIEYIDHNAFMLKDKMGDLFSVDSFRQVSNSSHIKREVLDLKLAQMTLTQKKEYDLIILDDMMWSEGLYPCGSPNSLETGEYLLSDIRSKGSINRKTPIIMHTQRNENKKAQLKSYKRLGANIWVPKQGASITGYLSDDVKTPKNVKILKRNSRALEIIAALGEFPWINDSKDPNRWEKIEQAMKNERREKTNSFNAYPSAPGVYVQNQKRTLEDYELIELETSGWNSSEEARDHIKEMAIDKGCEVIVDLKTNNVSEVMGGLFFTTTDTDYGFYGTGLKLKKS